MKETNILRAFSFSTYTTQALLVSYFPLYFISKNFGASKIGIIYALGPLISIFANIITGTLSDRFRTIKKIFHILLIGQLIIIHLLFGSESFGWVCVIMLSFYFFQTPMNTLSDSLTLLSSKHTGTPFSLVRIFGSLGFASAALLFGYILEQIGISNTVTVAIITIACSTLLSFQLNDYQEPAKKYEFKAFIKLVQQKEIVLFFTILMLLSIAHRMNEGFLAVTMHKLGASDSLIGFAWLASATSEIPVFFLLGKYGHRFKPLPLLAFAGFMYACRFALVSVVQSPLWLVPIQAMHSVTFGIFLVTALRYITVVIPDEYRSSGQALFAVVWIGIAGVISGTLGGAVYEHYGQTAFYLVATTLAAAAALFFVWKHRWLTTKQ